MSWLKRLVRAAPPPEFMPGVSIQHLIGHRCLVWQCHPGYWIVNCPEQRCPFLRVADSLPVGVDAGADHYRETIELSPPQPWDPATNPA